MTSKKFTAAVAVALAAVMMLGTTIGLLAGTVSAASSSEIQSQIDKLEQEQEALRQQIAALENSVAQNKTDIKSLVLRKTGIDQQMVLLQSQITSVKQSITAYNLMIADKQDELDAAESRMERLQKAYKARIRAMEEQGEISYWAVIFEANSFFDMLDQLNMVAEIERADRRRMEELRQVAQQVEEARTALQEHKKELEQKRKDLEEAEAELQVKEIEASGLLVALLAKGNAYELDLNESERLQHELMNQLAGLEADKEMAEYLEWLATSVPPTTTTVPPTTTTVPPTTKPRPTTRPTTVPPTTAPVQSGYPAGTAREYDGYVWLTPTSDYHVSSEFGYRYHPISGKWTYHYGIDMAAPEGTPVYATRAGVVRVAAYEEGGAGWHVSLGHAGGYVSVYFHMLKNIQVKKGDYVEAGQLLGYVGSTGGSTGNHLHFGIAKDSVFIDPRSVIFV